MSNEMRLIDANAMHEFVQDMVAKKEGAFADGVPYEWAYTLTAVDMQPTVDAKPVVHGRWEIFDDGYGCELMCCSACKSEFYDGDNDTVDHPHNYCPHCGADMMERS